VRKVDVDTDFESDQVPFELSTLPLQKLQDLICTMLMEIKYFIFIFIYGHDLYSFKLKCVKILNVFLELEVRLNLNLSLRI